MKRFLILPAIELGTGAPPDTIPSMALPSKSSSNKSLTTDGTPPLIVTYSLAIIAAATE